MTLSYAFPKLWPLFEVTGNYRAVVNPLTSSTTNDARITVISGTVDFFPRLPEGFIGYFTGMGYNSGAQNRDTGVVFPKITARINEGVLSTINMVDAPGIYLPTNHEALGADLIYDVRFRNIVYNRADQILAPFAFTAPASTNKISTDYNICLTDPNLIRLAYKPQPGR